jgi:DNA-binding MarR family transcriptional regulator
VLGIIGQYGPLSATEVGNISLMRPDKVTRALNALVERRLVIRTSDPDDRRFVSLRLSAEGKRINEEANAIRNAMEFELLASFTREEIDQLYIFLDRLSERAKAIYGHGNRWT